MMGSDITWECIGKDSFLVNLTIYRDCNGIPMPSAQLIVKCKSSSSQITSKRISAPTGKDITPTCGSSCTRCSNSGCSFPYGIEEYKFQTIIYLGNAPNNCCEVVLSFSQCCRNLTITTGAQNKNFYIDAILNRCVSPCDNSPTFTNPPIAIICVGQDFTFNHGVIDTDVDPIKGGLIDSLSYQWTYPLSGQGATIPYSGNYDYNKPIYFWGFPNTKLPLPRGFHLDKVTGDISFRPMKQEQTVMPLFIKEYRWDSSKNKMVLIGQIRRDIQIIVIACPNNHMPSLGNPYYKSVCANSSVSFSIKTNDQDSKDSLKISWNAAIPGATWTDNNGKVKHPTGVMTWTPSEKHVSNIPYVFTATVKDDACPVNGSSTRAYQILVKPLPKAKIDVIDSGCGNYWLFATPIVGSQPTFFWSGNFKPGFTSTKRWVHYKFRRPGEYPFSLTITAKKCEKSYFDTIVVDTFLQVDKIPDYHNCYLDSVSLKIDYNYNIGDVKFQWYNSPWDTNNFNEIKADTLPTKKFVITTDTQLVYKAWDSIGCWDKDTIRIDMHKYPIIDAGDDVRLCSDGILRRSASFVFDKTGMDSVVWLQKDGTPLTPDSTITFNDSGIFYVYVKDSIGCESTDSVEVVVNPELVANAMGVTICLKDTAFLEASETGSKTSNVRYYWYHNKSILKTGRKAYLVPSASTFVWLYVKETIGQTECVDSIRVNIKVNPLPNIDIKPIDERCVYGTNAKYLKLNDYLTTTPFNTSREWSCWKKPNAIISDQFNHVLAGVGSHIVTIKATNPYTQCVNYDSAIVKVNSLPNVNAGVDDTMCSSEGKMLLKGNPSIPAGEWSNYGGHGGVLDSAGRWYFNPYAKGVINGEKNGLIYTFTDKAGCTNTDTINIVVYNTPLAKPGTYADVCINGEKVILDKGRPVYSTDKYGNQIPGKWNGSGVNKTYPFTFEPAVAGIGIHTLKYIVYNVQCFDTAETTIKVNDMPVLQVQTADSRVKYCSNNGEVILIGTGNPAGGSGGWYGTSVSNNRFDPSIVTVNDVQTDYVLTYEYTDPNSCKNTKELKLTIVPEPEILIDKNVQKVCYPQPFEAKATYKNADSIEWSKVSGKAFGNIQDKNSDLVSYIPGNDDLNNLEFTLMVKTLSRSNVCAPAYDTITIPLSGIPIAQFDYSPKSGCNPLKVNFVDSSTIETGRITNWKWVFGDGNDTNAQNVTHVYSSPGIYNVTFITKSNAGCKSQISKYVQVYNVPKANFNAIPPKVMLSTPNIKFQNLTSYDKNEGINYLWNFDDPKSGDKNKSELMHPSHRYSDTGIYKVELLATTRFDCSSSIVKNVEITPDVRAYIPSAFSPNNVGVSLNEVYKVSCHGFLEFHIQIFDRWGALIYESQNYDLHGWDGTYINNDTQVPIGTYVCILRLKGIDEKMYKYSATINLIR